MMWDNWLGEFDGMGAIEDLTGQIKGWKHYAATTPTAWQTVTVKGKILSFPWALTNDAIFVRTDRVKEYGLKAPTFNWTTDDFLTLAKGFTKPENNQYGFGLRGGGAWAVLYATEFMYGNGAQVLKDGKVAINSPEAVQAFEWYIDLIRKVKVTPPSAPTDAYRQIVEGFGRRRHEHVSSQLGLDRRTEEVRRRGEFCHAPDPNGPGQEARLLLLLRDAHRVQSGQEQGWGLEVHDLPDGRRTPLPVLQDTRPVAHTGGAYQATAVHRGRVRGIRRVLPLLHRQPLPCLSRGW